MVAKASSVLLLSALCILLVHYCGTKQYDGDVSSALCSWMQQVCNAWLVMCVQKTKKNRTSTTAAHTCRESIHPISRCYQAHMHPAHGARLGRHIARHSTLSTVICYQPSGLERWHAVAAQSNSSTSVQMHMSIQLHSAPCPCADHFALPTKPPHV